MMCVCEAMAWCVTGFAVKRLFVDSHAGQSLADEESVKTTRVYH